MAFWRRSRYASLQPITSGRGGRGGLLSQSLEDRRRLALRHAGRLGPAASLRVPHLHEAGFGRAWIGPRQVVLGDWTLWVRQCLGRHRERLDARSLGHAARDDAVV